MENLEYQSVEEQLDERVIEIARVSKTVKSHLNGGNRTLNVTQVTVCSVRYAINQDCIVVRWCIA